MNDISNRPARPIGGLELAFLRMNDAPTWATINLLMILERPVEAAALEAMIEGRLLRFGRFRETPVVNGDKAHWNADDGIDVRKHIRVEHLQNGAGRAELMDAVASRANTAFDESRPWWEVVSFPEYGTGGALLLRLHHVYGDGRCVAAVLDAITSSTAEASLAPIPAREEVAPADGDGGSPLLRKKPTAGAHGVLDFLRKRGSDIRTLAKLIGLKREQATGFEAVPDLTKRLAFSEPLSFDALKRSARALQCTPNDLMLAAVAGAVRRRILREGRDPAAVRCKVSVPVDLFSRRAIRELRSAGALRNLFGSVLVHLPVHFPTAEERIRTIRDALRRDLASIEPHLTYETMCLFESRPREAVLKRMRSGEPLASGIVSMLIGPDADVYLAGSRIAESTFWAPTPLLPGTAFGVGILGYAGKIQFGVSTAANAGLDPGRLARDIFEEASAILDGA